MNELIKKRIYNLLFNNLILLLAINIFYYFKSEKINWDLLLGKNFDHLIACIYIFTIFSALIIFTRIIVKNKQSVNKGDVKQIYVVFNMGDFFVNLVYGIGVLMILFGAVLSGAFLIQKGYIARKLCRFGIGYLNSIEYKI